MEESLMKNMKKTVAVLAIAVGLAPLGAVGQAGADTYKAKCASCHGAAGKPSAVGEKMGAKDFASADVQGKSDQQLSDAIKSGQGKMPAYKGKLTDDQVKDLVTYIRSLKK
jgi:mono/diheme cytochrome c family protein